MSGSTSESNEPPIKGVLSRTVSFRILGDEGILFSQATGSLYRLNTTATFIWCCNEQGIAPLVIARMLSERFGVSRRLARRDVARALSDWKSQGLLGNDPVEIVESQHSASTTPVPVMDTPQAVASLGLSCRPARFERHYHLLDVKFLIRFPCRETEKLVHPVLAHLEARPDGEHRDTPVIFDIHASLGGYAVFRDTIPVAECLDRLELAPVLQHESLLAAYESTDCLVAIHAAAVCGNKGCVLMPGAKGSGKSTLTAALMGSGLTYLTDELSLLMRGTHHLRPAPVSLGLKHGSWPILESTYGNLDSLPIHQQNGNIAVRYLPPLKECLPPGQRYPIACVVFPKYETGESTTLTALAPAEALYRLAEAGYAVPGKLNTECVEALIEWIMPITCYELRVGDLGKAIHSIKELLL